MNDIYVEHVASVILPQIVKTLCNTPYYDFLLMMGHEAIFSAMDMMTFMAANVLSVSSSKQKRQTHAERVEKLVLMGGLKPRFVDEHGLSIYLGIAVNTLQKLRGSLPRKWTTETLKAALEKGLVSPPVTMMGGKKMYDLDLVDKWIDFLPVIGQLPNEQAELELNEGTRTK